MYWPPNEKLRVLLFFRNHRSPHRTAGQGQPMFPLPARPIHLILVIVMFTSNKHNNSPLKWQLFSLKKNFKLVPLPIWVNFTSHHRPRHFLNTLQVIWRTFISHLKAFVLHVNGKFSRFWTKALNGSLEFTVLSININRVAFLAMRICSKVFTMWILA